MPVLHRAHNLLPLLASIKANSTLPHDMLFLVSPGDVAYKQALVRAGVPYSVVSWQPGAADWAKKMEHGRAETVTPLLLLAADDLRFHSGWDVALHNAYHQYDVGVLGTQDMGNRLVMRGLHSTHPCVVRDYADCHGTIDDPQLMLHQGYDHQYADNELCETAMARGCWKFVPECVLEHLHPAWGKAKGDSTYLKANRRWRQDMQLFQRRRRLWRQGRAGVRRLT